MNIKKNIRQTISGLLQNLPIVIAILLLISIIKNLGLFALISTLEDNFLGILITDFVGSLAAGNPINSYILAGEIGNFENKIILISTFLISWVTVGFLQIPGEIYFLGKKFSILRNILSFIFAMIGGYLVYYFYNFF